ncbi:MAG: Gfo/Idh/MocA family oxidoreductase [Bacillota bacterium]
MHKLKMGIIGTGMAFERLHYPAYQQLADKYEIVALCDVDEFKARDWANRLQLDQGSVYTDFREMLKRDDLDVIDIIVPIPQNFEVTEAVAASLAGKRKGIICEKPLAPSLNQAREARTLAQKYNIPILVAENYRYNQEVDIIRDLVRTKRIGDVFYFIQNRVIDFPGDMIKDKFAAPFSSPAYRAAEPSAKRQK